MIHRVMLFGVILAGLALGGGAEAREPFDNEVTMTARGTFDVKVTPQPAMTRGAARSAGSFSTSGSTVTFKGPVSVRCWRQKRLSRTRRLRRAGTGDRHAARETRQFHPAAQGDDAPGRLPHGRDRGPGFRNR
jgi:hypothetical protein